MCNAKTQQTQSTVTIPPEVLARYNAVNKRAEEAANTPFQEYSSDPNKFVAGLSDAQTGGINQITANANAAQPAYQAAFGAAGQGMGDVNLGELDTQKYMNPYVENVAKSTMNLLNQQNAQDQSGLAGQAAMSGAMGGDRSGVASANLARQQQMANASSISNIYSQGYQQAQNTAQQQQAAQLAAQQANKQRYQQGAQLLAGLGQGQQSAALQGGQAMMDAGKQQQQTEQAKLSAMYNQFQQKRAYPFQTAQFLANIAMGTGANSGSTTTSTSPASFFGGLASGGVAGERTGLAAGGDPSGDYSADVMKGLFGGIDPNSGAYGAGNDDLGGGDIGGKGYVPKADLKVGSLQTAAAPTPQKQTSVSDVIDSAKGMYDKAKAVPAEWEKLKGMFSKANGGRVERADGGALGLGGDSTQAGLGAAVAQDNAAPTPANAGDKGPVPDNTMTQTPKLAVAQAPEAKQGGGLGDIAKIAGMFLNTGGRAGLAGGGGLFGDDKTDEPDKVETGLAPAAMPTPTNINKPDATPAPVPANAGDKGPVPNNTPTNIPQLAVAQAPEAKQGGGLGDIAKIAGLFLNTGGRAGFAVGGDPDADANGLGPADADADDPIVTQYKQKQAEEAAAKAKAAATPQQDPFVIGVIKNLWSSMQSPVPEKTSYQLGLEKKQQQYRDIANSTKDPIKSQAYLDAANKINTRPAGIYNPGGFKPEDAVLGPPIPAGLGAAKAPEASEPEPAQDQTQAAPIPQPKTVSTTQEVTSTEDTPQKKAYDAKKENEAKSYEDLAARERDPKQKQEYLNNAKSIRSGEQMLDDSPEAHSQYDAAMKNQQPKTGVAGADIADDETDATQKTTPTGIAPVSDDDYSVDDGQSATPASPTGVAPPTRSTKKPVSFAGDAIAKGLNPNRATMEDVYGHEIPTQSSGVKIAPANDVPDGTPDQGGKGFTIVDDRAIGKVPTKPSQTGSWMMQRLQKDFGLSPAAAAGFAGNGEIESQGYRTLQEINPTVKGSRGGYGWMQWTGPRRRAYEAYAKANNLNPSSPEANYGFMKYELQNTPEGQNTLRKLQGVKDPAQAALIVSKNYLMPGIPHNEKRMAAAQSYFNKGSGTTQVADADSSGVAGANITPASDTPIDQRTGKYIQPQQGQGQPNILERILGTGAASGQGADKSLLIPILQGLGAMASSPSRTFGGALLQGVGAGATAYQNYPKVQAEIANQQLAAAQAKQNMIQGDVFVDKLGRPAITLKDGSSMPLNQYQKMRVKPLTFSQGVGAGATGEAVAPAIGNAPPPPEPGQEPEVQGAEPTAPEQQEAPAAPVSKPQQSETLAAPSDDAPLSSTAESTAQKAADNFYASGPTGRSADDPGANPFTPAETRAADAGTKYGQNLNYVSTLSKTPENLAGSWAQNVAEKTGIYNSMMNALGLPSMAVNKEGVSESEIIRKFANLASSDNSKGVSAANVEQMLHAVPNLGLSKGAQASVVSNLMSMQQQAFDENNFMRKYKQSLIDKGIPQKEAQVSGMGARAAFMREYGPRLNAERQIMEKMFNDKVMINGEVLKDDKGKPQTIFGYMADNSGKIPPGAMKYFQKKYEKDPKFKNIIPGMIRYFHGGENA